MPKQDGNIKIVESFIRENGTNQENYENNLAANENKAIIKPLV